MSAEQRQPRVRISGEFGDAGPGTQREEIHDVHHTVSKQRKELSLPTLSTTLSVKAARGSAPACPRTSATASVHAAGPGVVAAGVRP
ncbi:hypothetical protein Sm713_50300 [Streptomyces sp. TS71-3]|nr:hypothetical protein Sm713_50300 [Streptomyces sp. TS71-3]